MNRLNLEGLVSFATSRKRFINTGKVSLALEYLPENLEDLRDILKDIPGSTENLEDFCEYYNFNLSKIIIDEECEDYSQSRNGGDYWKNHRELIIYEDSYIKIFMECDYRTSYDGGCCQFCGNYGSSTCCEPSIGAIRK